MNKEAIIDKKMNYLKWIAEHPGKTLREFEEKFGKKGSILYKYVRQGLVEMERIGKGHLISVFFITKRGLDRIEFYESSYEHKKAIYE